MKEVCFAFSGRSEELLQSVFLPDSSFEGIPAIRFGLDFGDARKNEKLQCYCMDPPHDCPRPGKFVEMSHFIVVI